VLLNIVNQASGHSNKTELLAPPQYVQYQPSTNALLEKIVVNPDNNHPSYFGAPPSTLLDWFLK
jgi:hypothetical protein